MYLTLKYLVFLKFVQSICFHLSIFPHSLSASDELQLFDMSIFNKSNKQHPDQLGRNDIQTLKKHAVLNSKNKDDI